MNFVKTYIYKQEYTEEGIKELEKDARSVKEIDENKILKDLPEFKRGNNFLSLSEQLELNKNNIGTATKENQDNANLYDAPNINDENIDLYGNHEIHDNYSVEKIKEREKEVADEYKEAIKKYVKKKELINIASHDDILKDNINHNFKKIKKEIINKKKNNNEIKTNIKAIIKTTKKKTDNPNFDNKNIHKELSQNTEKKNIEQTQISFLLSGYSDNSDD
ncbi:conserved Plasmodium protein, unknown function [Plasmodium berghei]|uniref:Uncharacterized protein n=2 Tax=Plasmodium berghei TaxID=5821 RepID=A0A509AQD9_PLABA|nr:conserved protein, unknown function [Plasmodium berghei ANKA]CXI73516.1 conserved Plasmodium protein, unknown function [Plasmodium berghei]SCM24560.1 conserved Plasmodium protein, unknown function [Plasmodium berghei]SCN27100.1 conserved Plasmodium protein, unknown function [Plasmodium berghei]SCO61602.1 conserved Plasmodium protein, unknown function [Plasmodium berghei]SCO63522.1 conserved Plasmodium protein, unknown function [Plasmodium berghei]|eukprot:XP_034422734.1 conserved protein, unknown function [Plasmodium berghei ANKA]